ncbi:MAG: hypothetical protein ACRD4G_15635 [Bryobacteraceae bacterium]
MPHFRKALAIAAATPDSGYPFFTYQAELQTFIGLKQYDDALRVGKDMLRHASLKHLAGPQAEVLPYLARVALAGGDTQRAIADLKKSIAVCKAAGYQHEKAEPEAMLAEIFSKQRDFR